MRVCLMNDNFYRSSGVAIALRRIWEAATEVDYWFAGCAADGLLEDLSWIPAGRFQRFDLKSGNPVRVAAELARFRNWFKGQRFQLVHCHHRRISVLLQAAGLPVLYTGHLAFPPSFWFRHFSPSRMTAVSRSVEQNIMKTTGRAVLACIGNPLYFPEAPPVIPLEEAAGRAVCIARLEPVKGHTHLLAAWKELSLRGHEYHLDLVGEGSLQDKLTKQAKSEGISHLVHFCGFSTNVSTFLKRSLFAVLASEVEGQPTVTLEAAAVGRASLVTAVDGSVDVLPPDRALTNGLPYGSPSALADALEEWFANPQEVTAEGRRFFDFLKPSSDPRRIARAYTDVYATATLLNSALREGTNASTPVHPSKRRPLTMPEDSI